MCTVDHVVLGMYYECRNETAFLRVEGESRNVKGLIMRGRHSNRCGPENCFHQFKCYSEYNRISKYTELILCLENLF